MTEILRRNVNKNSQYRAGGMPAFVSNTGNLDRKRHLEMVRRIREGIDPKARHLPFAGCELSIPELDFAIIRVRYPELTSKCPTERTRAWQKFANSPESEPYRLYRLKRGPQCRSITAR